MADTPRYLHMTESEIAEVADALRKAGNTKLADDLAGRLKPEDDWSAYVEAAKNLHADEGEVEIDDNAIVSKGDPDGAYVMAWVWVNDEGLK